MIIKDVVKNFYKKYMEKVVSDYKGDFLVILMYHNIGNFQRNITISPKDFENGIIELLELDFKNYSLSELIRKHFNFEGKSFVITFDDGEKGVIEYGLPILKKYNLKATLFISPFLTGKSYGFSWRKVPKSIITLEELDKYDGYRIDIIDEKDIMLWLENGFELGSHGYNHVDLASISLNEEYLEKEIYLSQRIIEDKYRIKIESFCYPFGSFNNIVKNVVKRYYKCALTIENNVLFQNRDIDLYALPRLSGCNSFGILFKLYHVLRKGDF